MGEGKTLDEVMSQETPRTDEERGIRRASDLLRKEVTEIPMLFAPVFSAVGVSVLAGMSDAGKSMLLRNMAICVTTGRDFLSWKYQGTRRSCIFVSTEDDEEATSFLLHSHNSTYQDEAEGWGGLRFIFSNENIVEKLDVELSIEPADLVVVDAYSDVFDGKEQNSAAQVRDFINPYKELAKKHQCHVLFLHHTGKGKEDFAPSKNNFVGSQSLEAAVRLGIELRADKNDPDLRHFCIVKGNYLGRNFKDASFVLRMNSGFVFENTFRRVPFGELGQTPVRSNVGRKPRDIEEKPDAEYIQTFRGFFTGGNMGKKRLKEKIMEAQTCGNDVAERIITYAEEKGWIRNISDKGNKFEYECLC